jgi:hypothetical protein
MMAWRWHGDGMVIAPQLPVGEWLQMGMANEVFEHVVLDNVEHSRHLLLVVPRHATPRLLQRRVVGNVYKH